MAALTVSLLDYGAGNVRSVRNALSALGYAVVEIDTYDLESYVRGTGLLFDGARSDFKLIGDLSFEGNVISYRFDEILSFKIPLQPRSRVSGRVELTRGDDGLIEKYREFWDQSVPDTLFALVLDGVGVKRAAFPVD